ncbi:hypothetical protein DR096_03590 [Mycoplasma hyopneumoniae]|nr:hypothetical protein [Mesomycoplasma hyopneumoniae]
MAKNLKKRGKPDTFLKLSHQTGKLGKKQHNNCYAKIKKYLNSKYFFILESNLGTCINLF